MSTPTNPIIEVPLTREAQLRTLLTVVSDAVRRARDAVPETVSAGVDLDATQSQIEFAMRHLNKITSSCNGWRLRLPADKS